ncbi:MAG: flagellar biosynthesis anti-sigma factor FlgM [Cycloclasticus sp.]|nr:flagellar biosynthesis anti-sigma factor FlgM [Cycloclasticus sp.]
MSINIRRPSTKPSQSTANKAGGASKSSKGSAKPTASKTTNNDSVDLTTTASTLQEIERSLGDIPIVDNNRVEAISKTIEDGDYHIDNEKIADRIIKSETDLKK